MTDIEVDHGGWRVEDADRAAQTRAAAVRAQALTRMCPQAGCHAAPGDACRNVHTGDPLRYPAHALRIHPPPLKPPRPDPIAALDELLSDHDREATP